MKQKYCLCITIVLLIALFTSCSKNQEGQKGTDGEKPGDMYLSEEPESRVKDFPSDGIYIQYVVNSSAAGRISGTTMQNVQDQKSTKVTATANLGYRFVGWSDGQEDSVRQGDTAKENQVITAIFDYDKLEMPIISLVTETGRDVESKEEYIKAKMTILGAEKEYNLDSLEIQIRGRGNNTWTYDKKSYKIKLGEKQSLLGLGQGKAKKWVLLANHCDQSHLRNYVTLHLAASMPALAWSPDCTPVEVYLNGGYRGVYLLAEEVDVNKNKVAVSEDVTGAGYDIGFLIEMTGNAKDVIFEAGGKSYQIHNDLSEDDRESREQYYYIQEYVEKCWEVLQEGNEDTIAEYMDIDSMVDAYLVEEIVKNMDVGWDSFYLYKDAGGKLTFGPLWDFDLALGNCNQGVETYDALYAAYTVGGSQSNPWFYTAMNCYWFRQRVVDRWDEIAELRGGFSKMVTETAQKYYNSFCRNFDKWKIFGQSLNRETQQITSLSNYEEHYRFLAEWIEKRLAWLDDCYHDESFLDGWTGYASKPGEGQAAGDRIGNKDASSLFDGYTRLAVLANSVQSTVGGFGGEEVRNLFDNNVQTKYCANIGNGQDPTVEITFTLSKGASLSGYAFCTANDTSGNPGRNPRSWVLFAKASDGSWVEIDACDSASMGLEATDYTCYGRFCDTSANAEAYTDYKLVISHREIMQLSDIVLFGDKLN